MKDEIKFWNEKLKKEKEISPKEIELLQTHIHFFEHERGIHLIVTISFSFYFLYSLTMLLWKPNLLWIILFLILGVILGFYIRHYYILENGVQTLHKLYDRCIEKEKVS